MRYTLFSLAFLTAICFTACDDSKEYGDGLEEKTLISEITLANVENGKTDFGCVCGLYGLFDTV